MRYFLRLLVLACLPLIPLAALSQTTPPPTSVPTVAAPAPAPAVSTPVPTPPTGQFVTVKDGSATISGGTLIGEAIMWASLLIGAPLAGLIATWLIKLLKRMGVDNADSYRDRLKEFVENGLALAAQRAQVDLKDKMSIDVRSKVAVDAMKYVQDHGAETLKALGVDPNDGAAIEALQARIAKAMDDKVPPPTSATVVAPATAA